jgi:hypothetical protein
MSDVKMGTAESIAFLLVLVALLETACWVIFGPFGLVVGAFLLAGMLYVQLDMN